MLLNFGLNVIIVLLTFNCLNMIFFVTKYGLKIYDVGNNDLNKVKDNADSFYELYKNQQVSSNDNMKENIIQ